MLLIFPMETTLHYFFKPCIKQNTKTVLKCRPPHVRNGANEKNIFLKIYFFSLENAKYQKNEAWHS